MSGNTRTDWLTQINCDVKCCPPKELFYNGDNFRTVLTYKAHRRAFLKRQRKMFNEQLSVLNDIKIDSKKYYKGNTEAGLKFLDDDTLFSFRRRAGQMGVTLRTDEEHRSLWLKIYTKKCKRRKRIKSDDVFKLIDKYEMNKFIDWTKWDQRGDADPYLTITEYIAQRYDGPACGLILYTLARKNKVDNMIQKMGTNFITRLYNPHTELGHNYALKNIEWAFD